MLERLKAAVEQKAGRKMRTPKDFDVLHQLLFDEMHTLVSTSTLKRIWGYVQTDGDPRPSSLTPLAQYVGYDDWEAFCQAMGNKAEEADAQSAPTRGKAFAWRLAMLAIVAVAALLAIVYFSKRPTAATAPQTAAPSGMRVLHKGQDCFGSIDEYLSLFGVTATDTAYFQPLPGQDYVYLWGPEYGNTTWHNEGDKQQLMPTITEYWTPSVDDYDAEYVRLANKFLYYERMAHDELRITFMRNIVDSLYMFLGIYRMDTSLSSPEKFVWRRVADDCDLGLLPQLQQLRR